MSVVNNITINEQLIEDSLRIDSGIRSLQSKLSNVIDGITDKNADPMEIIEKYQKELAEIQTELTEFLDQQQKFHHMIENAEKEITSMAEEVKKMMTQNNITIDEDDLENGNDANES